MLPRVTDLPETEPASEELEQRTPEYHNSDDEVADTEWQYSTRHPTDWVISGPLADGKGPGRRFVSWKLAERWAREFYGDRLKGRVETHGLRWAFLIRR